MNSGYINHSMSKRAAQAYRSGKQPFSKLPNKVKKLGLDNFNKFVNPCEWHHTSKHFNSTDFYELEEVLATFGLQESDEFEAKPEAVKFLAEFKKETGQEEKFTAKEVHWLEWGGTQRHPTCKEKKLKSVEISTKNHKTFIFYNGNVKVTKRITTRGFKIIK